MAPSVAEESRLRRRDALVRAFQTYYLFRNRRREKSGLKALTFLGIAVPLLAGGLVQLLYSGKTPPAYLVVGSGVAGLALAVLSLWAVVDRWDEKAQMSRETVTRFRDLVTKLEQVRVLDDGTFVPPDFPDLEQRSYEGRIPDDDLGISERAKQRALTKAEAKYPNL
jgi:hypothetical protein